MVEPAAGCCLDTNSFIKNQICLQAQNSHHHLNRIMRSALLRVSPPPLSYYSLPLVLSFFSDLLPPRFLHSSEITGAQNKRLSPPPDPHVSQHFDFMTSSGAACGTRKSLGTDGG